MSQKTGFVYIWYDRKHRRFYIGSHWGSPGDGYICSSKWMKQAYKHRPYDFKRRILSKFEDKKSMYAEESRLLRMIKPGEVKTRYYNLNRGETNHWSATPEARTVAQKSGDTRRGRSLPCTPEKAAAISKSKKGNPLSEQHKAALKEAKKGIKLSDEHKKAISAGVLRTRTPEVVQSISEKNMGRRRKINYCKTCGVDTGSRRRQFCKEHRYLAMNQTRSQSLGTKWCKDSF